MTIKQFQNHLLRLARGAICARSELEKVMNELDAQVFAEYELDIESIILDLNNVVSDCAYLARIMHVNADNE